MSKQLSQEQKSKRMVIFWLCSFFGVIFAMNIYMVFKANTTFNGLVAQKSYQQGINYNQTLANKKQIVEEGLTYDLLLKAKPNRILDIQLNLKHTNKDYKMPENVVLTFWRPVTQGSDFQVNLLAKNNYKMRIKFLENQLGAWSIKYQLKTLDNKVVDFNHRVNVR